MVYAGTQRRFRIHVVEKDANRGGAVSEGADDLGCIRNADNDAKTGMQGPSNWQ